MKIDMDSLDTSNRYRLLAGTVTPRPIAWITTRNEDSGANLAPYSFFNIIGTTPPLLAFTTSRRRAGGLKDTHENIRRGGEFVVNLVSKQLLDAMNISAAAFPPLVSEVEKSGVAICPADAVDADRLLDAPASFECRLWKIVELSDELTLIIGQILLMHIVDDAIASTEPMRVKNEMLRLVGRMHGDRYIDAHESYRLQPIMID